jgi:hypothetical protein
VNSGVPVTEGVLEPDVAADAADALNAAGMPIMAIATATAAILALDILVPPNGIRILKF